MTADLPVFLLPRGFVWTILYCSSFTQFATFTSILLFIDIYIPFSPSIEIIEIKILLKFESAIANFFFLMIQFKVSFMLPILTICNVNFTVKLCSLDWSYLSLLALLPGGSN